MHVELDLGAEARPEVDVDAAVAALVERRHLARGEAAPPEPALLLKVLQRAHKLLEVAHLHHHGIMASHVTI